MYNLNLFEVQLKPCSDWMTITECRVDTSARCIVHLNASQNAGIDSRYVGILNASVEERDIKLSGWNEGWHRTNVGYLWCSMKPQRPNDIVNGLCFILIARHHDKLKGKLS